MNVTKTLRTWTNEEKFIFEGLSIQRAALIPHHNIEADIGINIYIMVAPKNQDSQELEFEKTFHALSFEQRCELMVRDICLSLDGFRAQNDLNVRCFSKLGPPISKDCMNSHPGPKEKTLPTPSPDQVLNGGFEEQQG